MLLLLPKAAIQQFGGRTKGSSDGVLLLDQAAETVAKVGLQRPHQFGLRLACIWLGLGVHRQYRLDQHWLSAL